VGEGIDPGLRAQISATASRNITVLREVADVGRRAIRMSEAHRRQVGDVRDTLKWFAAFSTAGLLFVAQRISDLSHDHVLTLHEGIGLVIAVLAFVASIGGAAAHLVAVDLGTGAWLRGLIARIEQDDGDLRTAVAAYAKVESALAADDLEAVTEALKAANGPLGEVSGRGAPTVTPGFRLVRLEEICVWTTVAGFAIGVASVIGDYVAKMPV
jgi:hypothetical protein